MNENVKGVRIAIIGYELRGTRKLQKHYGVEVALNNLATIKNNNELLEKAEEGAFFFAPMSTK